MKERLLIIEDDPDISSLLEMHLSELGYEVDVANDGNTGLSMALSGQYVLIILDLMLPGKDGHDICKAVRQYDPGIPILMLSVKSDLVDKVLGLEFGADDYLTKPFRIQELLARVKALRRRSNLPVGKENSEATTLTAGEIEIDINKRRVKVRAETIELTPKQFDLLVFLASRPGRAFTRAELLTYVWDYDSIGYEHTIDSHINRLRSRIEVNPSEPEYIVTVWGVGYKFRDDDES